MNAGVPYPGLPERFHAAPTGEEDVQEDQVGIIPPEAILQFAPAGDGLLETEVLGSGKSHSVLTLELQ